MRVILSSIIFLSLTTRVRAQVTGGSIAGKVKAENGIPLQGASIRIKHGATGTLYFSTSGKTGNFFVPDVSPGNGYSAEVFFVNHESEVRSNITVNLGEETTVDFVMKQNATVLKEVTVSAAHQNRNSGMVITREKMDLLPGRNMYEQLRSIPVASLSAGNEGGISFAGQNNRYNAMYIDGAINNDVFGLAASGTNGGQAGISILPADAIAQFQVALTPYDASLGNFTGAAINATTRSGTNQKENSVYHYFSNRDLSGKTPVGEKKDAAKLNTFFSGTYGWRTQGAFIKNKLFYFANIELQREVFSQPFLFDRYKGNTKDIRLLNILANTVKASYHYDPGSFLDNPETVNTDRVVMRLDWNINWRNSLSVSHRYTYAQRMNANAGNENTIHFSNDGYAFFSGTNSLSLEWKSSFNKSTANKLLVTYTKVNDDREPLDKPFPRVRINDGEGAILFGTDNSSTINQLIQSNLGVADKFKFNLGAHLLTTGFDIEHNRIRNAFIQNSFGSYTYSSPGDFLTNDHPSAYQLGFSLVDNINADQTMASAAFSVLRTAVFVNDELRFKKFVLNYGIRFDKHLFLTAPARNDYVNDVALPQFAKYWDTEGALSGAQMNIPLSVSPRIGFSYRDAKHAVAIRGGAGIFSGRLPLAWPGGVYNNNGLYIGGFSANLSQLGKIRFRSDPFRQWTPRDFNSAGNKEPLNLISEKFSMPELFRVSLAAEKKWSDWITSVELMFSKNVNEIRYTNLNLLPPIGTAEGPDRRFIYPDVNNARIGLEAGGSNPFDYAILLGNNKERTGYAYDLSFGLVGLPGHNWKADISYHFGHSCVNNEGTSSVNLTQWRTMETVNGRNFLTRSVSDFSPGHRVFAVFSRVFRGRHGGASTTCSFTYNGQSGAPVSYVYDGSMTRDDGAFGAYDLIYVPTAEELAGAVFLPNTVNGTIYTPAQQKEAFNRLIENDGYLKSRRGNYAERNGSRMPFEHVVDLKILYDLRLKVAGNKCRLQLSFDLFNFTNFLNRDWGRRYFQPNGQVALLDFAGYTGAGATVPQFKFDATTELKEKWTASLSTTPAYSARWNGRLGIRLLF